MLLFFFNDTAATEIYTLSLHDALPIYGVEAEDAFFDAEQNAQLILDAEQYYRSMFGGRVQSWNLRDQHMASTLDALVDRKSTRLNSSHANISYAVFCLKKKKVK